MVIEREELQVHCVRLPVKQSKRRSTEFRENSHSSPSLAGLCRARIARRVIVVLVLEPIGPNLELLLRVHRMVLGFVSPYDLMHQLIAKHRLSVLVLQQQLRDYRRADPDQCLEFVTLCVELHVAVDGDHVAVLGPVEEAVTDEPVSREVLVEDGANLACLVGIITRSVFEIALQVVVYKRR